MNQNSEFIKAYLEGLRVKPENISIQRYSANVSVEKIVAMRSPESSYRSKAAQGLVQEPKAFGYVHDDGSTVYYIIGPNLDAQLLMPGKSVHLTQRQGDLSMDVSYGLGRYGTGTDTYSTRIERVLGSEMSETYLGPIYQYEPLISRDTSVQSKEDFISFLREIGPKGVEKHLEELRELEKKEQEEQQEQASSHTR